VRAVAVLIAIIMGLGCFFTSGEALGVAARAAILMDVNSGRVLYGKNIHSRLPMASLTKIMTALLAAESGKLDELVTVQEEWITVPPSNIWLTAGESISLRNLVYGLLLRSGNDAAMSIAYFLAGGVAPFSQAMNKRAKELGALDTNFSNPHGLHARDHYSTAYDLALITRSLLHNPFLRSVVRTERFDSRRYGGDVPRIWHNKNRLLQMEEQADGIKTAWTVAAGHCFAASATRHGWQLLSIVLNSPNHYGESRSLLSFGFANYAPTLVVPRGLFQGQVSVPGGEPSLVGVVAAQDLWWVQGHREEPAAEAEVQVILPKFLKPPIALAQVLGELTVSSRGELWGRVELISDTVVREASLWRQLLRQVRDYVQFVNWPFTPAL